LLIKRISQQFGDFEFKILG